MHFLLCIWCAFYYALFDAHYAMFLQFMLHLLCIHIYVHLSFYMFISILFMIYIYAISYWLLHSHVSAHFLLFHILTLPYILEPLSLPIHLGFPPPELRAELEAPGTCPHFLASILGQTHRLITGICAGPGEHEMSTHGACFTSSASLAVVVGTKKSGCDKGGHLRSWASRTCQRGCRRHETSTWGACFVSPASAPVAMGRGMVWVDYMWKRAPVGPGKQQQSTQTEKTQDEHTLLLVSRLW
jgi:hypothetical protein